MMIYYNDNDDCDDDLDDETDDDGYHDWWSVSENQPALPTATCHDDDDFNEDNLVD